MALTNEQRSWYYDWIKKLDPSRAIVAVDRDNGLLTYCSDVQSDESLTRAADPEECVRALAVVILCGKGLGYVPDRLYIERYYHHGHPSSKRDEVDLIILDPEDLPFSMWEFKAHDEWAPKRDEFIRLQLFGTAPLVGTPSLLVYATIDPLTPEPHLKCEVIDYTKYPSYEGWVDSGESFADHIEPRYGVPEHKPLINDTPGGLRQDSTREDFRSVAAAFHGEFFGEHPDNTIFTNLLKCLLAKIYDERQTKKGDEYGFQVTYPGGSEEPAEDIFNRVNDLYRHAYKRYIAATAADADEINANEFGPDRVKAVVKALQGMALTAGAALHGDVIGAFFEEILRLGFKQDKGMYFTHANLVRFIIEVLDLEGLTADTWQSATHPENRLPYVIDPACGSGTFLLEAMKTITSTVRSRAASLVTDSDAEQFFDARMSDAMPNYWAEAFIYGLDPKFVMAITAKVNMVLHGDGSAHIFKDDSLKSLEKFPDKRLSPQGSSSRDITENQYPAPVSEGFDVVVSNPPFGIKLSQEVRKDLSDAYTLPGSPPSEALFLERWFQLLRPGGRLGVVIPESLVNTGDAAPYRLFLYRHFWVRAIVSLPRNLFIDTPTLTSLLFAQRKSRQEVATWDSAWTSHASTVDKGLKAAQDFLKDARKDEGLAAQDIEDGVLDKLPPAVDARTVVVKKGKAVMRFRVPAGLDRIGAIAYYRDLLKLSGTTVILRNWIFSQVVATEDYEFPVYEVDEVGYKLSARRERVRPNQLIRFIGSDTGEEIPNLHLTTEPVEVVIDSASPSRVLDYVKGDVKWA